MLADARNAQRGIDEEYVLIRRIVATKTQTPRGVGAYVAVVRRHWPVRKATESGAEQSRKRSETVRPQILLPYAVVGVTDLYTSSDWAVSSFVQRRLVNP